jgi:hypothetical protein
MAFFAIWGLIFFLLFVAGWVVVLVVGLVSGSHRLVRLGARPLAVLGALLFCLVVFAGVYQAIDRHHAHDPAWIFEKEFGFPPSRDVIGLEGYATQLGRQGGQELPSRCVYLRFTTPVCMLDAIRSDWLKPATRGEPPNLRLKELPAWWKPPSVPLGQLFVAERSMTHWPSDSLDSAVLYYDSETGNAYFAQECFGD